MGYSPEHLGVGSLLSSRRESSPLRSKCPNTEQIPNISTAIRSIDTLNTLHLGTLDPRGQGSVSQELATRSRSETGPKSRTKCSRFQALRSGF